MSRSALGSIIAAVVCFALCAWIGLAVSHVPPSTTDASELGQFGVATPLAAFLTAAGRFPVYFAVCVLALIGGVVRRPVLAVAMTGVAGIIVVWKCSDGLKAYFERVRPPHPIIAESSTSYPSGHADLVFFTFGFIALAVWRSGASRPVKIGVVVAATIWALAVGWSRLALGAHYPSDVLGGYLFGAAWLLVAAALPVWPAPSTAGARLLSADSPPQKSQ